MKRIARPEAVGSPRTARIRRNVVTACGPEGLIGCNGRLGSLRVDSLEQAPAQHLSRFVLLSRVQQGRLARRDTLCLRHAVRNELVLCRVGVGSATVLADRQGVDQRRLRRPLDCLEERRQERSQLVARGADLLHLAEIDGELVEKDQRRLAAEQLP